ncbi:hypothetical protein EC12741_4471 [Escherichia coli 1.2741]|nr:hypothetical protein ECSTEC7V_1193 [Escherichia coli STEC_7v]EIG79273.1 hypothetical protein EC12741_4471 [Escherichia coli 1.2741]
MWHLHRVYAFDIQITVTALPETDTVTGVPAFSLNTLIQIAMQTGL